LEELPPRPVPMLFEPFREPSTCRLELPARRAPPDARHACAIWHPGERDSQTREASLQAGVKTAEPPPVGLLRGDVEAAFRQPLREYPVEPCGVILVAEGADPVVGLAAQPCLTATVGLAHVVKPPGQGLVYRHLGEDG